jgi:uncharacterized iron-regulated membrane protein
MRTRQLWVLVHRYTGLTLTLFLVIVALTGSLLAFYSELDRFNSPQLFVENHGSKSLDMASLAEKAALLVPNAQVDSVWFDYDLAQVQVYISPRIDPQTQQPHNIGFEQIVLNPYTGEELGRRNWGAISEGLHNLMPFIYKLHYSLALDEVGIWVLGITALVWTLDCFVGFYLTLPVTRKEPKGKAKAEMGKYNIFGQGKTGFVSLGDAVAASGGLPSTSPQKNQRSFWQRWKPAWKIKGQASALRITFDLHRASGLWLWLILLLFAWSSVYMNLSDTVYTSLTRQLFNYHEPWTDLSKLEKPLTQPILDWREAYNQALNLSKEAEVAHHFSLEYPVYLSINRDLGVYDFKFRSSLDIQDKFGNTRLFFDANTGKLKLLLLPTSQYSGNTVTNWLIALHMANVFGMPYRIFVCLLGLSIVMLTVTGVVIWFKKRSAAKAKHNIITCSTKTLV